MSAVVNDNSRTWDSWYPVAAMFLINGVVFGMWATQIPAFKEALALDPFVLSLILFVLGAGTVLAMTLSVWLIRTFGLAQVTRYSTVLYCGLGILVPLAPSAAMLAGVVFLFGAAGGAMNVGMNAIASDLERRAARPLMSSFHGMWSLGGFIGSGSGAVLMGLSSPAVEASSISVAMFLLFLRSQRGMSSTTPKEPARRGAVRGERAHGRDGRALTMGVMALLAFAGEGVVLDWGAVYMKHDLGAGNELALTGYVAFAGSMAIMRFAGDFIRQAFSARALVGAGALVAAFGLVIGPASRDPVIMIAGCAMAGAGLANLVPVLFSLAGSLPRPELQIATVSTMGFGGLLAVPPLLGAVGQHYGLGTILFVGAAGDAAIAVLALMVGGTSLKSERRAGT